MCMKRVKFTLAVLIVSLLTGKFVYLQWGRDMGVYSTHSTLSENSHEEHIIFVANRLFIGDKEACAEELVRKCRENSFPSVLLSYDLVKPTALYGTVYRFQSDVADHAPVFTFRYIQKAEETGTYNFLDRPEKFILEVD